MTSSPTRPSTIYDVAKLAAVCTMTVSRTLNGHPSVSPKTREAVLRAAKLLNYQRNENARSIRPGHRTGLIGVAITNIGNPYYAEFAMGIEAVAASHGRRVFLATTGGDVSQEAQIVSDFLGRQVEGLIVVPSGGSPEHLQSARLRNVPLVLASRAVEHLQADSVLIDDSGGAYQGARYLLDKGHRRIGYLGISDSSSTGSGRLQGFMRAFADLGLTPDRDLIRMGLGNSDIAAREVEDLLQGSRPTAIFCSNNRITIGALRALSAISAKNVNPDALPEIVSFDDFELSELVPFSVTTINHDARALGHQSAELLFNRIANPNGELPAQTICLPTWLETGKGFRRVRGE